MKRIKLDFIEGESSNWTCPKCNKGVLMPLNSVGHYPTLENRNAFEKMSEDGSWDDDYYEGIFSSIFECSNTNCKESIGITGKSFFHTYEGGCDEDGPCITNSLYRHVPKYFTESPFLIQIPENCPVEIINIVKDSFKLFWCDESSCANKIRKIIEILVINLGVSSRDNDTLHSKIIKLSIIDSLAQVKNQAKSLRNVCKNRRLQIRIYSNRHNEIYNIGDLPSYNDIFRKYKKDFKDGVYYEILNGNNIEKKNRLLNESIYFRRLFSLKIIGNIGSHKEHISQTDLINAYRILEILLFEIYDKTKHEVEIIQNNIISQERKK